MKKLLLAVLALTFAAGAGAQTPIQARLTFLHINDVYQISPRRGMGGFGPLMTLLKEERVKAPHAVLTFGGDLISPSLLSSITKGAHMIELMNAIGADLAVFGNHEFDFGADVAQARIAESKFTWLGANVLGRDGRVFGGAVASRIRAMGPLKVGFFGLVTPQARLYIRGTTPVVFAPFLPAAKAAVAQLRQDGAQVIVALTHMNLSEDLELVREIEGIHLVLGGHEHVPLTLLERGVLILKAGSDAEFLGVVELEVGVEGERMTAVPSWRFVANHRIKADEDIQAIVRVHEQRLEREFALPIGKTETAMDSRANAVRGGEAAIGNLIADAMRDAVNADVALMNGGGIRGNKVYPPNSTITRRDIFSEMPFGNVVTVLEAKGAVIKDMIEHGLSRAGRENAAFPHLSGVAVVFDSSLPAGRRATEILIGGAPLDPERLYRLATNDFLASGGDGFAMLAPLRRILDANAGPLLAQVVMDYVALKHTVSPQVEGRVRKTR